MSYSSTPGKVAHFQGTIYLGSSNIYMLSSDHKFFSRRYLSGPFNSIMNPLYSRSTYLPRFPRVDSTTSTFVLAIIGFHTRSRHLQYGFAFRRTDTRHICSIDDPFDYILLHNSHIRCNASSQQTTFYKGARKG